MSNSSKQRQFLTVTMRALKADDYKVSLTQNKHYRLKIEKNNKSCVVFAAVSPSCLYNSTKQTTSTIKRQIVANKLAANDNLPELKNSA
jgi:hypothetical protein